MQRVCGVCWDKLFFTGPDDPAIPIMVIKLEEITCIQCRVRSLITVVNIMSELYTV